MEPPVKIVTYPSQTHAGKKIVEHLKDYGLYVELLVLNEQYFSDGEIWVQVPESIRNARCFFLTSLLEGGPNNGLMKYMVAVDAMQRAPVHEIQTIAPYIPYQRQDRKDKPRVSIAAKVVAGMLEFSASVKNIITMDLHVPQEEAFYQRVNVDHLTGDVLLAQYYMGLFDGQLENVVVVAPDQGSGKRAQKFAKRLNNRPLVTIDKRRSEAEQIEEMSVLSSIRIRGMTAIIIDDLCGTGGTLIKAAEALREQRGVAEVHAAVTHGLFLNDAEKKFRDADLRVATLETIPRSVEYKKVNGHIAFIDITEFLAKTIAANLDPKGNVSQLLA